MDDWDAAQDKQPKPAFLNRRQIRFILAGAVVLLGINVALQLGVKHQTHHQTPAERDAAVRQAASLLLGGGDDTLTADDPDGLDLLLGQSVVLRGREAQVRVTPEHVSVATGDCVDGPALTVDLDVDQLQGSAELKPIEFSVLTTDGESVLATPACSTGFDDEAPKRTLVFGTAKPGQLRYGTGTAPEAIWHLT